MKSKLISFSTVLSLCVVQLTALSFIRPKLARSHPAALAVPAICVGSAGVGCVVVFSAVVGGVLYQVWRTNTGQHLAAINALDVLKLGNTHWVNQRSDCHEMSKKYGWRIIQILPSEHGGFWCIFDGKQTSFGGGND